MFLPALYVAWFRVQPVDLSMGGQEDIALLVCLQACSLPNSETKAPDYVMSPRG
jgi:hypothetical protein